jgi:mannose-6-phosphate isomerase-like protein (cupin superfamily)
MSAEGWQRARIDEIRAFPPADDPSYWKEWSEDPTYASRWHSVREHFGLEAFGVNASEGEAGQELVVPHDEIAFGGQEELYAVIRGRARFVCDDEVLELGPGELLYVPPAVRRSANALETPTTLLMIGGVAGKPYEPDWEP